MSFGLSAHCLSVTFKVQTTHSFNISIFQSWLALAEITAALYSDPEGNAAYDRTGSPTRSSQCPNHVSPHQITYLPMSLISWNEVRDRYTSLGLVENARRKCVSSDTMPAQVLFAFVMVSIRGQDDETLSQDLLA